MDIPEAMEVQTSCKAFKGFKTRQKEEKETQTETVSTSRLSRAENTDRCKICAILLCDRWKKYYQYTAVDECSRMDIPKDV